MRVILSILVALILVVSGPEVFAQPPSVIKIGATLAVTGGFSPEWGPSFLEFMRTWEKVVNEEGGVLVKELGKKLPVQLIVYDDESNADKSVELYEKLAAVDKVHIFLGPSTSPITLRATTVAERLSIPMVLAEANDLAIFARGFKWIAAVLDLAEAWTIPLYEIIKDSNQRGLTDYKSVAIVMSDTPHTKDVGTNGVANAKKAGFNVVASELVPFRTVDFSAVIAKLKIANPDLVVLVLWDAEAKAFIKQATEVGFKPKQIYSRFMGKPLLTGIGSDQAEGMIGATVTAPKMFDPRVNKIFLRMGIDPYDLPWAVVKYGALETIVKGIELAGSLDREKVMTVFRDPNTRIPMIWGDLKFSWDVKRGDKTLGGVGTLVPIVAQFQGGKLRVIWPGKWADGAFQPGWRPK